MDPKKFKPIYEESSLLEIYSVRLKMEFATTETEISKANLEAGLLPLANELLSSLTNKVIHRAKLTSAFAELYPVVKTYVSTRCFGMTVDLDSEKVRSHLSRPEIQEAIAHYLAQEIAKLIVETKKLEFEKKDFKVSDTKPFSWRRNLPPPLVCKRTIFNYVASFNNFERKFAKFLDVAPDVLRFASLGTTEQGDSGTQFRVDYLKSSGAIGFYHPDWVVVQKTNGGEVSWIIETKGRVWEGTDAKDKSIQDWCTRITKQTGKPWKFYRVNQSTFESDKPTTLADATSTERKSDIATKLV